MDLYRKLIADTALFGISTFGARFLNFLLTPFYTRVLSSAEYGVTDLIIQSGDLIIPLASIGIADGVIRFGLERSTDKNAVFTTGLTITLGGSAVLLAVSPLLERLPFLTGHMWLVLLYVMMANVHSVCDQFARTMGHIRLFALDGILRTVAAITCNILFLAVFSMGVTGYVLSSILADALTTVLLFLCAKQWRHFRLSALSGRMAGQMLRYSAPLVPTSICGWIINISDRYLIALLAGSAATGIYAVSNKIPTVLFTVANVFISAWQLSSMREQSREEKERFFSNVFSVYSSIACVVASGVIMTARLSTRMLAAPEYFEAWRYVPVLTLATTFACLGSFLSSIYMVEKRSAATLVTTLLGAAGSLIGNVFLIQLWGPMGAAISTLLSYILIFGMRAIHTRSMIRLEWNVGRSLANLFLLSAQCISIEQDIPLWPVWSALCFLTVVAVDRKPLLDAIKKAIH